VTLIQHQYHIRHVLEMTSAYLNSDISVGNAWMTHEQVGGDTDVYRHQSSYLGCDPFELSANAEEFALHGRVTHTHSQTHTGTLATITYTLDLSHPITRDLVNFVGEHLHKQDAADAAIIPMVKKHISETRANAPMQIFSLQAFNRITDQASVHWDIRLHSDAFKYHAFAC